jgi:Tol biopolymer transport system component
MERENAENRAFHGKTLATVAAVAALSVALVFLLRSVLPGRNGDSGEGQKVAEEGEYQFFAPSPDGRYIAAVELQSGNLVLCDFASRNFRLLTHKPPNVRDGAWSASFSRDGRTIAYEWSGPQGPQIWLAGLDNRSDHLLYQAPQVTRASPVEWSPNGASIIVQTVGTDYRVQFGLLAVASGIFTPLPLDKYQRVGRIIFSPDGTELWFDARIHPHPGKRGIFAVSLDGARQRTLLVDDCSSYIGGLSPDRSQIAIISDRDGTYGLWKVSLDGGMRFGRPELVVNGTGPITPLGVTKDGALFHTSYADSPSIYLAKLDPGKKSLLSPPKRLERKYLGHVSPAFSADGTKLSYIAWRTAFEPLIGILAGEGQLRELEVGLDQFVRPSWRDNRRLVLYGSGQGQTGYFELDTETGALGFLLDASAAEANGEGAWSRGGDIWYNRFGNPRRGIFRYDFRTGIRTNLYTPVAESETVQPNVSLSPDGVSLAFCIRESSGTLKIMAIPAAGGNARPLWSFDESSGNRAIPLEWLPDSKRLLVARSLGENANELWQVPADGSAPEKIDFPNIPVRSLRVSADGKTLACVTGANRIELRKINHAFR